VNEFIDVLNRLKKEGRFQAFGCSNWTIERLAEANSYAAQNGLEGFSILNNQMSLARMVDPVWSACLSVSDQESRAWLAQRDFPLLAWSSQARGFFTERAGLEKMGDAELVRCWYAEDNFKRKERAAELARRKGVEEINIALAYVLAQPFPVWTLIGPASTGEAASCFRALDIKLTPEEMRWLNLEI
jgi:aryl-alcohol dehydrogenase-like predicted oxidoreductase